MGRQKRDSAKFNFLGKRVEMYRPTDGQGAALSLVGSGRTPEEKKAGLVRFFRILQSLVVSPSMWEWMDDQMVEGGAQVSDFSTLLKEVFENEWDVKASDDDSE